MTNVRSFMRTFLSSFESITARKVISSLESTLRKMKTKLEVVRTSLQTNNVELNSSISSKITKLQDDLATKNKIIDALVVKNGKDWKVFRNHAQFQNKGRKCCEAIKKENPKPTVKPTVKPKKDNKLKDNVASDSKGKENLNEEPIIDDSEEEEHDGHELKRRRGREDQMDKHQRIIREVEEKESVEHESKVTLESPKLLFPVLTLEHIMSEVVDLPS
ncbi:unnamed protein product [Lactuca saligna]|uniref:Uncharacterized protein n=1 Tax=Lactuca saligna TaxID=75948 RepID=A0AA35ZNA8_LACSI|nr:unnamed protein product [Lactuca saligna]